MEPEYILNNDSLVEAAFRLERRLKKLIPGFDAQQSLNTLMRTCVEHFGESDSDLLIIKKSLANPPKPQGSVQIYTICERPLDFPEEYVVRVHYATPQGQVVVGPVLGISKTLQGARKMLPQGLTNIGREPADETQIVESWI